MKAIQVHHRDPAVLEQLIVELLNRGFWIGKSLDEVPSAKVASADPLNRPTIDLRPLGKPVPAFEPATDAEMAAEEARIESMTGFPAKIADRPQDREAVKARIRAQREEADAFRAKRDADHANDLARFEMTARRVRDVDEAMRIACPTCRVKAEMRCVKASGVNYDRGFAHAARIRKARGH